MLNTGWEFGQCFFLYDMWDWGFWRATVWMWGAILGDVFIVAGVVFLSTFLVGAQRLTSPNLRGWLGLLLVGLVAGMSLEWLARVLDLWDYTARMSTVPVAGYTVGLSPVVQVTVLPALSLYLAVRRRTQESRA